MKGIKWVFIIVLGLWLLGLGVEALVKNENLEINKQLVDSSKHIVKKIIDTSKTISDEFTLHVPKASIEERVATIKFSEPKRMASEKLCNQAILVAMSDKSNKAQQAKETACKKDN